MHRTASGIFAASLLFLFSTSAQAAAAAGGFAELSWLWSIPFVGVLLSIALFPLFAPHAWHHHQGKIAVFWMLLFLLPALMSFGLNTISHVVAHTLIAEYIPFVILISSLYIISGGIFIKGNLHGSPKVNTALLAIGTFLASFMGTTGAAMLMIRPLLRANDNRKHNTHVVVFFIFLVANIGGSLTPLGDPPLFLGFLKGVPFLWTAQHIWMETTLSVAILLALFYLIDSHYYHRKDEEFAASYDPTPDTKRISFLGSINFLWLLGAVGFVLLSGLWQGGVAFNLLGTDVYWQNLIRDLGLIAMAALSWLTTQSSIRASNEFNFAPVFEVGKLFLAIFVTIAPVISMLQAGLNGPFSDLVQFVHDSSGTPIDVRYFWITGLLSGFLDNAPTYLVFFNLAGGDVAVLTTKLANTLAAISAGAVFMGALSYIGNAPNFMVKAIAEHSGVKMPSFFGYLGWSIAILIPLFILLSLLFF